MYLIMMIDSLGKRYGMMPSRVLAEATTMDLYVLEKALWYQNLDRDEQGNVIKPPPKLSVAEMQALVDQVRAQNNV